MSVMLLAVHVAATWFMVGLIWFVQVVHYAMFDRVGADCFVRYEADHQRLTTWVVGPVMLVEMVSGVALLWARPAGVSLGWVVAGLVMIGMIWASTAALQVPMHCRLQQGYVAASHRTLVRTNWLRTALWSARGVLVLVMLTRAVAG